MGVAVVVTPRKRAAVGARTLLFGEGFFLTMPTDTTKALDPQSSLDEKRQKRRKERGGSRSGAMVLSSALRLEEGLPAGEPAPLVGPFEAPFPTAPLPTQSSSSRRMPACIVGLGVACAWRTRLAGRLAGLLWGLLLVDGGAVLGCGGLTGCL